MSFQAPLFLAALALVPTALGLAHFARRRRDRYAIRFPSVPTLARVAGTAPRWRRVLPSALLTLALTGLVLALARPETTVAVPVERASVMLVTDASGSMQATDVSPTRLAAAQTAARGFLDEVPDELRVGLLSFADAPRGLTPPEQDRAGVRAALDSLQADGGTATGDALANALAALREGEGGGDPPPAAIVLLSDGETTNGRDPVDVAREAERAGVPIHTVALGTPDGVIERPGGRSIPVPPDPEALRQIAAVSGGQAFTAEDAGALDTVYERLGSQIGTRPDRREVTAGFAAAGLALLAAAVATSLRFGGRLP